MLKKYKLINNLLGWAVCIIASLVYLLTAEPTVSFWDCGEYIATAYKLQVGHPPGAPTFQLLGRIFSFFAGDDVTKVAFCINSMSALCSGFTILFLFWSLTMLGRKLATVNNSELTTAKVIAIFGSALIGSLAYTFTDTFWFSAVEGEVYAMSSLCTALVFWAILKWDMVADENYSFRWIIFIAFVIGLSIGVHLLNLLTIPAMGLIIYFRKYKPTSKGVIIAIIVSFLAVGLILWGIVPGIVKYLGLFERLFTNSLGTRFYVGTIVYFVLIVALLTWGIWYSEKRRKRLLNLCLLSLTFLLIGYSTFFILVIRSNANPPIDENNPEDAVSLLAYLNRDQYGSNPLVYGQYYNSRVKEYKNGTPFYAKKYVVTSPSLHGDLVSFYDKAEAEKYVANNSSKYGDLEIRGRYVVSDSREKSEPVYYGEDCTLFPRMWSNRDDFYIRHYKQWADITGPDYIVNARGERVPNIPTFGQNLKFFFSYQMWYMYGRYFMWNFVGRQTLAQGYATKTSGEWVSGIKFIDEARLGPQDMPDHMKNKGNNKYYFLPLILGLIGLFYQLKHDKKNWSVVFMLFFMTGIAIGIYLNMYAYQPRERDYAFAASFYAFSIWIGLGVYAIFAWIEKYMNKNLAAGVATLACVSVPTILAAQNWDDHDRSNRYLTLAIAKSYLDCCPKNAILFANGDNDTFPLWYLQEVEGYRTDVRICNLSLMGTDWYIDQMRRKAYDGDPVPIKMTKEMYQQGTRDLLVAQNRIKTPQNLVNVMQEIYKPTNNRRDAMIPTTSFYLNVDKEKVLANGIVPEKYADQIVDKIVWKMPETSLYQTNGQDSIMVISKAYIGMMDILANNNWERPICYVATTGNEAFFGLENYFQSNGMVFQLVPIFSIPENSFRFIGLINSDTMYNNLMNKFDYTQYAQKDIFLSEDYTRMATNVKIFYYRLAKKLVEEQQFDKAEKVLDRMYQCFTQEAIPYDFLEVQIAYTYLLTNTPSGIEKGIKLMNDLADQMLSENAYYAKFTGEKASYVSSQFGRNRALLNQIHEQCSMFAQSPNFAPYKDKLDEIDKKSNVY